MSERCQNPWKKNCKNTDIAVSIVHEGEPKPICTSCSNEILSEGTSGKEWEGGY